MDGGYEGRDGGTNSGWRWLIMVVAADGGDEGSG